MKLRAVRAERALPVPYLFLYRAVTGPSIDSPYAGPLIDSVDDRAGLAVHAAAVARGICRLFARNDIWCLTEMPLRSGRRADLMGIDGKGHIILVEIKVSRADLVGDAKWPDYFDHCDRFFWGLAAHLDRSCMASEAFLPERCGLIVADGYDGEILRPAPLVPLSTVRRKAEIECLARASLRRQAIANDAGIGQWGDHSE